MQTVTKGIIDIEDRFPAMENLKIVKLNFKHHIVGSCIKIQIFIILRKILKELDNPATTE